MSHLAKVTQHHSQLRQKLRSSNTQYGKMRRESAQKREALGFTTEVSKSFYMTLSAKRRFRIRGVFHLATKALLIVGLLVLLGCAPQATPTPTIDLQATIEALRTEPTPMVVVIATSTPTATPTSTPTPTTPTPMPIPTLIPNPAVLQWYAEKCGTAIHTSNTTLDDTLKVLKSLPPPRGLEIFHERMIDMIATINAYEYHTADVQISISQFEDIKEGIAEDARDTLSSSGCW